MDGSSERKCGKCDAGIVLQMLSCVAEDERTNIRQRQAGDIAAAKVKGKRFGSECLVQPDSFEGLWTAWRSEQMSLQEAAEACGIPKSAFRDAVLRAKMAMSYIGVK